MHWHRLQLMSANTLCSALIKLFFSLSLERDLSLSLFSAQSASLNMFIIYQCLLLFHYYTRRKEQCWNISVNMFRTIRLKWNMFSLEIFIHTHTPLIFYTWWYFRSTYKYRANTFFNILTKISQIFIWKCHTFAITLQYFLSLSVCLLLSRSFEMTEMYMCWSNSIDQLFSLHLSLCLSICVCVHMDIDDVCQKCLNLWFQVKIFWLLNFLELGSGIEGFPPQFKCNEMHKKQIWSF